MKKVIALLLTVMMFSLVACGNQKETDGDKSSGTKADWLEGKVVFDGKEMQLPCKFSEIEAMGWKLKEGTIISDVLNYGPQMLYLENDNYDTFINVGIFKYGEEDISISECEAISIVVSNWMGETEDCPSISIDGLTLGDSKEKMIEILGEPSESKEDTDMPSYTYEKIDGKMRYCVSVSIMDGKIYMLQIVAQPISK